MDLPKVIEELIKAQDNHDVAAYAACFSGTASVVDEGNTYNGRQEIKAWIAKANEEFNTKMVPLEYNGVEQNGVLRAEISGNFDGGPAVLNYHFEYQDELIQSLKIT